MEPSKSREGVVRRQVGGVGCWSSTVLRTLAAFAKVALKDQTGEELAGGFRCVRRRSRLLRIHALGKHYLTLAGVEVLQPALNLEFGFAPAF